MPGDAQLAGEGSIFDVTGAKLECVFISAFEHNDRETETRNLEKPYGRSHPDLCLSRQQCRFRPNSAGWEGE